MSLKKGPMKCVSCDTEYRPDVGGALEVLSSVRTLPPAAVTNTEKKIASKKAEDEDEDGFKDDSFYFSDAPVLAPFRPANTEEDASAKIAKLLMQGGSFSRMY